MLPTPGLAAPAQVAVSGGVLQVEAPAVNDFALITLDGDAQVAEAALAPFAVTDARGTGQGWSLSLQATPFREWDGDGYVMGGAMLPAGSLTLPGFSVVPSENQSPGPHVVTGAITLDAGSVTVATAAVATGMGRYAFSPAALLQVALPGDAFARTYRSDLLLSVSSGP